MCNCDCDFIFHLHLIREYTYFKHVYNFVKAHWNSLQFFEHRKMSITLSTISVEVEKCDRATILGQSVGIFFEDREKIIIFTTCFYMSRNHGIVKSYFVNYVYILTLQRRSVSYIRL